MVLSSIAFLSTRGCVDGNCKNGKGKFKYASLSTYEGEWLAGLKHGYGVQEYGTFSKWAGEKYEGYWKDDKRHGQGKYTWTDGGIYEGLYEKGEKLKGKHTYGSKSEWAGDWYQGDFKKDDRHGYGRYYLSKWDITYKGTFKDNLMDGEGKMIFGQNSLNPGFVFEGEWIGGSNKEFQDIINNLSNKEKDNTLISL